MVAEAIWCIDGVLVLTCGMTYNAILLLLPIIHNVLCNIEYVARIAVAVWMFNLSKIVFTCIIQLN